MAVFRSCVCLTLFYSQKDPFFPLSNIGLSIRPKINTNPKQNLQGTAGKSAYVSSYTEMGGGRDSCLWDRTVGLKPNQEVLPWPSAT